MIPHIIHCVWLGGKQMPSEFCGYLSGWKELLPDWELRVWNETNFDFSNCLYAQQAYECKKYGFVSDYIRVCVLERYGGVYLDTDVELLRAFPQELLEKQLFIGFENDAHVETAVFGCVPSHPLVRTLRSMYERIPFLRKKGPDLTPNPIYFTYFLRRDYGLLLRESMQELPAAGSSVSVFPCEFFAPLNFNTKKDSRTARSVAVHHFANSWSPPGVKSCQRAVNALRKLFGKRIFASFTRLYVKSELKKTERKLYETSGPNP